MRKLWVLCCECVCMYCLTWLIIQQKTDSQGKSTRLLTSKHMKHSDKPLLKETMKNLQLLPGIEPYPLRWESITLTTAPISLSVLWLFCCCFWCIFALYLTGLSGMVLIWAAGARCKWRTHFHNSERWQNSKPQKSQSLGKHFTTELPYHWTTLPRLNETIFDKVCYSVLGHKQ